MRVEDGSRDSVDEEATVESVEKFLRSSKSLAYQHPLLEKLISTPIKLTKFVAETMMEPFLYAETLIKYNKLVKALAVTTASTSLPFLATIFLIEPDHLMAGIAAGFGTLFIEGLFLSNMRHSFLRNQALAERLE